MSLPQLTDTLQYIGAQHNWDLEQLFRGQPQLAVSTLDAAAPPSLAPRWQANWADGTLSVQDWLLGAIQQSYGISSAAARKSERKT